jgi:hypothetical protein
MATAEIHTATLTPGKLELLAEWLPSQNWFTGDVGDLTRVAAARFVDPDGEVGIETMLVGAGDQTFHVPLTYRGAPLADREAFLVGEMHHSVLGPRWVYDASGDPVYRAELRRVITEGDHEADLSQGDKTLTVLGRPRDDGGPLRDDATIEIVRVIGDESSSDAGGPGSLTGRWDRDGAPRSAVLARLRG